MPLIDARLRLKLFAPNLSIALAGNDNVVLLATSETSPAEFWQPRAERIGASADEFPSIKLAARNLITLENIQKHDRAPHLVGFS